MYKMLIVDDNNMQIKSLRTFIDWESFGITEIRTASNGKKGVDVFREFMPDIVITDVVMPIMDGIAMTKEIQAIKSDIKIIYMSCYEDAEYLKSAMSNKVTSYILKPFDTQKLTEAVEDVLKQLEKDKKHEALNRMFEEKGGLFREAFLFRLLYSNNVDFQFATSTLSELGFQKYDSYLVARFEITSAVKEYIEIYELLNFVNENILNEIDGQAFVETKRCLNLILMGDNCEKQNFAGYAAERIRRCVDLLEDTFDAELCVGISKESANLLDAQNMLRQASYVLENNLNIGENNVYFFNKFNYINMEYNIVELKKNLDEMINQKSPEAIELFLDHYWLKNQSYHVNEIKSFCLSVMMTLQLLLSERNFDLNDVFDGSEIIWQKLNQFETIKDARMWLYNILNLVITFFGNEEDNRQEDLVSEIIRYIDKHYCDVSNVEQIASRVYISPSYAKSLFKKSTGRTLSDYLNSKRMEEAKRLLAKPHSKVYEVAKMVGYKSKPYFVKAFKKYTGQLPSEYQKLSADGE